MYLAENRAGTERVNAFLDLLFIFGLWVFFASVWEFADADQDRENSHALHTPVVPPTTTMPTAPAAATPAPAASGKFQRYQRGRTMSNLFYDHHSVCSLFMGFVGTWHSLRAGLRSRKV